LASLVIFRGLSTDPAVQALKELLELIAARAHPVALLKAYSALATRMIEAIEGGEIPPGDPLSQHLISLILFDDNLLARSLALGGRDACDSAMLHRASVEWGILGPLCRLGMSGLANLLSTLVPNHLIDVDWRLLGSEHRYRTTTLEAETRTILAQEDSWPAVLEALELFWRRCGTGPFARYRAFRWIHDSQGGRLQPIAQPDPIRLDDLIGNDRERRLIVANTRHFLEGLPANNVLLYGDAGTGKSSLVKALLNEFSDQGLRLIEVAKENLGDFPYIAAQLRHRPHKFIIFVDDLSFEEQETQYKVLKAALEGTVEARPSNVLVYATSNRRHLVRESFTDRVTDGEIHVRDTQQEKISLADRFGLHLTFVSPGQEKYLQIVQGLAQRRGLSIDLDELKRRALQWAQWQRGWSGRTARQFVDHLTAELATAHLTEEDDSDLPGSGS
jgi:predicted AAA+ superfamily ATPase